jgi:glycosyltransferase involved in cell wall biosynthesis
MRILLIHKFHHALGGAERVYFDTARLLRAAGHEVAFFSMVHPKNESTPWARFFVSEVEYDDAGKSFRDKLRIATRIIWNHEANQKLEALIDEFQPDVAHVFNLYHQLSPSILWVLKRRHVPVVLTLCDFKVVSPNYFLYHFDERRIWRSTSGFRCIIDKAVKNSYSKSFVCALELWLHRLLGSYRTVALFLSPSQFLIDTYRSFGFRGNAQLVHHPVVTGEVNIPEKVIPLAERPEEYLYFGRFSPEKGVETVIRAFGQLPHKKLLLVGYGPEEERLKRLVTELHLDERVAFLGGVYGEDLERIIRRVRAVIMPPVWYENQPFVMMQTLLSGTLLIASRIGGIPDIVKDTKNGLLFEPGDVADLVRVMETLPWETYETMTAQARATVLPYTEECYLKEVEESYAKVLGEASRRVLS